MFFSKYSSSLSLSSELLKPTHFYFERVCSLANIAQAGRKSDLEGNLCESEFYNTEGDFWGLSKNTELKFMSMKEVICATVRLIYVFSMVLYKNTELD